MTITTTNPVEYYSSYQKHIEKFYAGMKENIFIEAYDKYLRDFQIEDDFLFFEQVQMGKPLEYILQEKFFYRSPFFVNEDVLIPRNETEILVEDVSSFILKNYVKDYRIAEVGIGSFAIGLSVLSELNQLAIKLWAGDICPSALAVAKVNQFRFQNKINTDSEIELVESDRLKELKHKVNCIVANPPYIKQSDQENVHTATLAFEPETALFLPDEIYGEWFTDFFKHSASSLDKDGALFMEGHEDTLLELKIIAEKYFKKVEIKKDYTGRDRFLHGFL